MGDVGRLGSTLTGRVAGVQGWVDRDIFWEEILEERQTAGKMRGVPASVGKSSMEYHIYRCST